MGGRLLGHDSVFFSEPDDLFDRREPDGELSSVDSEHEETWKSEEEELSMEEMDSIDALGRILLTGN